MSSLTPAIGLATLLAMSGAALAQTPAPTPVKRTTINAFLSASTTYNFNRPDTKQNQVRVFDTEVEAARFDVAELVIQRSAKDANQLGFRLDLTAGQSVPHITAANGLFRNVDTGKAEDFDLQQAFLTYILPLGRGLKIEAGKQVTHVGLELIEGYDGYNDQFSRSILFGYAIPFTHTGVRATYAASEKVSLMAMVVQGWDNFKDNNSSKSIGAQIGLTPSPKFSLFLNYLGGAERSDSADRRHLADIVAVIKPSAKLAISLNGDWATEKNAGGRGKDGEWNGLEASIRYAATDSFALSTRWERFDDKNGLRTGATQVVSELTLTPEFQISSRLLARIDFRHDWSNQLAFQKRKAEAVKTQSTIALNLLCHF